MHGDIALCEAQHSLAAFFNLIRLGVPFPHDQYGAYPGYKTDHDPRARATSAGPLTSHLMFRQLAAKVEAYGIPVHNGIVIIELVTRESGTGRAIAGAIGIDRAHTAGPACGLVSYAAEHVILATGGPAGIYRNSVYPLSQTGSIGMALKAGAIAQNLSISQFGIASVKFRWNLSGSYQQVVPRYFSVNQDNTDERDFLSNEFPDPETLYTAIFLKGYQWPFDPEKTMNFGSSRIDLLVQRETAAGRRVYIDFTRNPDGFSIDRLRPEARDYLVKSNAIAPLPIDRLRLLNQPAIDLYLSHNIDISREPLEIAVCAQHNNGGLTGDIWWESNIQNLFPVGEVNGSHGNTRPGGSALNAGQVGGIRAAMRIRLRMANQPASPVISTAGVMTSTERTLATIKQLGRGTGRLTWQAALAELQVRMSDHGGPVRNPATIREQVKLAWELYNRLQYDLKAVEPDEILSALRVLDLCLTHAVYLESIAEHLHSEVDKHQNILEIHLDDTLRVHKTWVPVRPVPRNELWFEQVWKDFLAAGPDRG
jgi:succinate dehydrogenase/fumarate reductase flavoprotein subunit